MKWLIACAIGFVAPALHAQSAPTAMRDQRFADQPFADQTVAGQANPGQPILPVTIAEEPVTMPSGPQEQTVTLQWPGPVHAEVEVTAYEVVIRFDRPLAEAEIARFTAEAGPLLGDLRWNDDSLIMRPAPAHRIAAQAHSDTVDVHFTAEAAERAAVADDGSSGRAADRELELARAQADNAAGYPGAAVQRLRLLALANPDDPQVRRALADTQAAAGALPAAAAGYRALKADDLAARRVIAEASGGTTAQTTYRHGATFAQWDGTLDASLAIGDHWSVGGGVRRVDSAADGVSTPSGYAAHLHRALHSGTLVATTWIGDQARLSTQVSTLFDHPVTGAAARLTVGPPERQARFYGAYRLPDFSTAEQSILGGHISRVGAGGILRITPELVAQADVTWTGYGLAGGGTRTTSTVVAGGADYLVLRGRRTLQLSYRLDAEYVGRRDLRANGLPFIPLSDRENHTVQAIFSTAVHQVQLTAAAGWTKDRFGGNGPTASLGAQANLGDTWRLGATGGVSSISRQAVSGRQVYLQITLTRFLRR